MKQVKLALATLLICFLIGGVAAQFTSAPVVAGEQVPAECNTACWIWRYHCDTCRVSGVPGWQVYKAYQSREYIDCVGPYDCYEEYDHCGFFDPCHHDTLPEG